MIKVKNTPNLLGITIHGDYDDLEMLHNSLFHYSDFYFDNKYLLLKQQCDSGEITETDKTNISFAMSNLHDCLLGLCYDIRHAYQGDRNIEYVENGADSIGRAAACIYEVNEAEFEEARQKGQQGNLYFNVEILYPWALYYLFNLSDILDEWYESDWLDNIDFPYSSLEMQRDRSLIRLFLDMIWINLHETLGPATVDTIRLFFDNSDGFYPINYLYIEAMCHYYILKGQTDTLKKNMLTVLCFEQMPTEEMYDDEELYPDAPVSSVRLEKCRLVYEKALDEISGATGAPMVLSDDFIAMFDYYFSGRMNISIQEKDEFMMNKFGTVNWDRLEW